MPAPVWVPLQPIDQLCAPGGLSISIELAVEFHTTMLAPAQPWPVPELPRLRTLIWLLVVMLSNRPPADQRWWGPVSAWDMVALLSRNTLGPGTFEPSTKSWRPSTERQRWNSTIWLLSVLNE